MQIKDFIKTKQNSQSHTEEEINFFIKNLSQFSQEEITAWLKAVKANKLDDNETAVLTLAMANSGTVLNWDDLEPVIDKHSTGGIGDKISLLFVPLVAAYGINIPKLSGRGLGITGGTIDKLESIPGLRTNLTINEIKEQVKKIKLVICGASTDLAPADKKLYAIRDVTNTVDSIPLIASSIMSKKIAGGARNIILDVKFGSGAFTKTIEDSRTLANKMVAIGKNLKRNIRAIISNMNEPLGYTVGNALEIKEVLEVLSGKEVDDLIEIVITLAKEAIMLVRTDHGVPLQEDKLKNILLKGDALKKFEEMVQAQGGNLKKDFEKSNHVEILKSNLDGYIQNIDAFLVGEIVHNLGAGRKLVSDQIDHSVGILFYKKHGDRVRENEPLLEIHTKTNEDAKIAKKKLISAIQFGQNNPTRLKLIEEIVK